MKYIFDTHLGQQIYCNSALFGMQSAVQVKVKGFYLSDDIAIETEDNDSGWTLQNGDSVSDSVAETLSKKSVLNYSYTKFFTDSVSIDFYTKPMRIAVLNLEHHPTGEIRDVLSAYKSSNVFYSKLAIYRYFKRKIGICGGPSARKSTTAQGICHRLASHYQANAFHVTEYATSFIQKYRKSPTFTDQLLIWHGQKERENNAGLANVVISDCPTFLSYIYMLLAEKDGMNNLYLSKIYKRVLADVETYKNIVFLPIEEYVENNVRFQNEKEAKEIEAKIKSFMEDHKIQHLSVLPSETHSLAEALFEINTSKGIEV